MKHITSYFLFATLSLSFLSGCSTISFGEDEQTSREVVRVKYIQVVVLEDKDGNELVLRSDDDGLISQRPPVPFRLLGSRKTCTRKKSEFWVGKKTEKDLELSMILDSLKTQRKLTNGQRYQLKWMPNCRRYRFGLHVVSKFIKGYKIKKVTQYKE